MTEPLILSAKGTKDCPKQYIARLKGRNIWWLFWREFVGKRSGERKEFTSCQVRYEKGYSNLYEVVDVDGFDPTAPCRISFRRPNGKNRRGRKKRWRRRLQRKSYHLITQNEKGEWRDQPLTQDEAFFFARLIELDRRCGWKTGYETLVREMLPEPNDVEVELDFYLERKGN